MSAGAAIAAGTVTARLVFLGALLTSAAASGAELEVEVTTAGQGLDGAIVVLFDATGAPIMVPERVATTHVVDQINKQFAPRISVIATGDAISFPNSDDIRHHVYSFSPAKQFELPLYHGVPTEPVNFDQAGVVAMGCNIHDGMSAHVYVADSDVYAISANGRAGFADLQPGAYQALVWHPQQSRSSQGRRTPVTVKAGTANRTTVDIALETLASKSGSELSPLELKFRQLRRDKE